MKKFTFVMMFLGIFFLVGMVTVTGKANATVVSLFGDKDGFGLAGAPAVPANGTLSEVFSSKIIEMPVRKQLTCSQTYGVILAVSVLISLTVWAALHRPVRPLVYRLQEFTISIRKPFTTYRSMAPPSVKFQPITMRTHTRKLNYTLSTFL